MVEVMTTDPSGIMAMRLEATRALAGPFGGPEYGDWRVLLVNISSDHIDPAVANNPVEEPRSASAAVYNASHKKEC